MDWTESFFGKNYLETSSPILTDEINVEHVDFIEKALDLKDNYNILNITCGFEIQSNLLQAKGYKVTDIDFNNYFINTSEEKNIQINNNVNNQFDTAIIFFTSFGDFDDNDNLKLLKNIVKSLKKNGKLLIESINREFVINDIRDNDQVSFTYPDNTVFMAKNRFDLIDSKWISDQITVSKGKAITKHQVVRLYTYTEISSLIKKVGMEIIKVYGDIDYTEYSVNSKKMIIIAQKISNKTLSR